MNLSTDFLPELSCWQRDTDIPVISVCLSNGGIV